MNQALNTISFHLSAQADRHPSNAVVRGELLEVAAEILEPRTEDPACLVDRPAVQIETGRRGGGGCVDDRVAVVAADANLLQGDSQRVGRDLGDLGVQALAHLDAAVLDVTPTRRPC